MSSRSLAARVDRIAREREECVRLGEEVLVLVEEAGWDSARLARVIDGIKAREAR